MKVNQIKQIWSKVWPYLFFAVVITIMVLPQLKAGALIYRGDTHFHFSRFYDAAMQIKDHNFSLFQTNYGFQHSGRIVNALYGPGFAYINGLVVLLVKNWFQYQIVTDYLICFIGASTMFYLLRYVNINKILAAILSAIYINIGLIPTYVDGGSFNGWGQVFTPLVLLCGVRMIKNHEHPINYLQLMTVISIVAQIHVLSTLMSVLLLIPFFLLGVYLANNRRDIWLSFFKSVLGTICLTANVWGSYIVLLSRNKLAVPDAYNLMYGGLRLGSYQGYKGTYGTMFAFVLPLVWSLFLLQFIYILFHLKDSLINTVVTMWGSILFAIATIYFPWGFVQRKLPFLQNTFQFPFRLIIIIYPMLLLGVGLTIQGNLLQVTWKKIVSYSIVGLVFVESLSSVFRTTEYYTLHHTGNKIAKKYSKSNDLRKFFKIKIYGNQLDYIATSTNNGNVVNTKKEYKKAEKEYKKYVIRRSNKFHHVVKSGKLILNWSGKNNKHIVLPVVMYAQSQLQVNDTEFKGNKTVLSSPIVKQKKGKNIAILSFKVPVYYYILLVIAIVSWLIVLGSLIYKKIMG